MGLYVDAFAVTGEPQPIRTAAGFLPLICGIPSVEQSRRLARHLSDPATFGTAVPVSTIAPCEPLYDKDMWRGPMWVNINWLIADGLRHCGMTEEAARLRETTCAIIEKYYEQYGVIFEFYDDEDRVPPPLLKRKTVNNPAEWIHQVVHDYTWTASLYLDMLWGGAA